MLLFIYTAPADSLCIDKCLVTIWTRLFTLSELDATGWDAIEHATTSRLQACHPSEYPHHLVEACTNLAQAQPQTIDGMLEAVLSQYTVHDNNQVLEAFR